MLAICGVTGVTSHLFWMFFFKFC